MCICALNLFKAIVIEGATCARDNLTVDEVIEGVFAVDNSEQEVFLF